MATRLTLFAIDRARLLTPVAALVTAFLVGSMDFLAAVFFLGAARFAEVLRLALLRDGDFFAGDFRAADFFAADFLAGAVFFERFFGAALRAAFLRAGDLRAEDFRALFFLVPPRDDFLAAAMLRAPM